MFQNFDTNPFNPFKGVNEHSTCPCVVAVRVTISEKKCGHLSTVIRVLCHECVHMSRWKTPKWSHHDAEFRRRTKVISDELGFDEKEL